MFEDFLGMVGGVLQCFWGVCGYFGGIGKEGRTHSRDKTTRPQKRPLELVFGGGCGGMRGDEMYYSNGIFGTKNVPPGYFYSECSLRKFGLHHGSEPQVLSS